jgi:thioredoxin
MRHLKYTLIGVAILFSIQGLLAQSGKTAEAGKSAKTETASGEVILLTKKDFLENIYNYEKNKESFVYEGALPCIIDFYADWCGPCRMVDPILKDLAKEYKGKVLIYKINIDNERELARMFGIQSIPTYFLIPAKGNPQSMMGAKPRDAFVKVIEDFLLKK